MSDHDDDAADDATQPDGAIGYGRPPKHSQFKKGCSGNPRGRPKGSKNLSTLIAEEMTQTVIATENGARKRIPKKQVIAKRIVNRAAEGDAKMITILLNGDGVQSEPQAGALDAGVPLHTEDELVIANVISRIRAAAPSPDSGGGEYQDGTATDAAADPSDSIPD